jgi:hypothetical protein
MGGVALGIAAGALAVPALLLAGPSTAWLGLAALVAALWIFAQPRFPADPGGRTEGGRPPLMPFLLLAYALSGAGLVPHMIYLADFAARGFNLGVTAGSGIWLLFGLGGLAGTVLGGRAADRIGGPASARIWLGVQVAALVFALLPWWPALLLSPLAGGFAAVGISAVTLAWAREVAGPRRGALGTRDGGLRGDAGRDGLRLRRDLRRDGREPPRGLPRRACLFGTEPRRDPRAASRLRRIAVASWLVHVADRLERNPSMAETSRVILVTGAASGIGAACCRAMAAPGHLAPDPHAQERRGRGAHRRGSSREGLGG